jgi:arylsulfatase A-like enzyme
VTLNGIVSHQDWLPTFAAAAGAPDIKSQLLKGVKLNGRSYKNYIDGYDMLDYLSGKAKDSPRPGFIYVNDDGEIVAVRWNDWKVVYKENRGEAFGVWREPFTDLRVPLIFNLRRDPFERAQHNSNTYDDWLLDRVFIIFGANAGAMQFLQTMKEFPPSQTPGSFNLDSVMKEIDKAGTTER